MWTLKRLEFFPLTFFSLENEVLYANVAFSFYLTVALQLTRRTCNKFIYQATILIACIFWPFLSLAGFKCLMILVMEEC